MKNRIVLILNVIIVVFTVVGLGIMIYHNGNDGGLLSSSGLSNLKYFTVLSNIFCGVVAGIYVGFQGYSSFKKTDPLEAQNASVPAKASEPKSCPSWLMTLKLTAASAVMVTFLVVACFFGPIYGYGMLYLGSNLWFHLIIPLLGMVEFCLLDGALPFLNTFLAGAPALVYGCVYLANILINGKGEWPKTNDWYGFMNWGFATAIGIFAAIVLVSWGVACLLRAINKAVQTIQFP